MFPVVVKVVIDAKAVPAAEAYAQVAASFVVTLNVVCVVPAASCPVGAVTMMVGGVVSTATFVRKSSTLQPLGAVS